MESYSCVLKYLRIDLVNETREDLWLKVMSPTIELPQTKLPYSQSHTNQTPLMDIHEFLK